ncbi:transporter substrate-binding domain-containing protein [Massilia sp. B-10]|nr:transporter substrate-binding domain-containing protein [Massilia sp. B-10]
MARCNARRRTPASPSPPNRPSPPSCSSRAASPATPPKKSTRSCAAPLPAVHDGADALERALTLAHTQHHTCVFMTTRTPERETWFHWIGPISQADWVLFGRADRHFEIRTLDDARGLRIGAYNGDVRGEFLKARGLNVEFAQNDDSNPKKLMLDRIDLWVNSTRSSRAVLARTGLTGKVVPVHTYQLVKLYLACNAAMPVVDIARMNGRCARWRPTAATRRSSSASNICRRRRCPCPEPRTAQTGCAAGGALSLLHEDAVVHRRDSGAG